MIKYDIGLGETCITVGLAKIEQGTAPDGRIEYDYTPVITFERLLKPQEIGSPVTEDTMKLDGAALFIHNRAGLEQMEKMVSLLKEMLDKKEAEEEKIEEIIAGYNQRFREKQQGRCPYTNNYCEHWQCENCEQEAKERKWMEEDT